MTFRPRRARASRLVEVMVASAAAVPETVIEIRGEIGPTSAVRAARVRAEISGSSGSILIEIDSPGGIVAEAQAIHRDIRACGRPVRAIVAKRCESAACLILAAAGRRTALPGATFLLHHAELAPPGAARWTSRRHSARAAMLARVDRDMLAMIAAATGADVERLERELADERTMSAGSALACGLINEIAGVTRPPTRAWAAAAHAILRGEASGRPGSPVAYAGPNYLFSRDFLRLCEEAPR